MALDPKVVKVMRAIRQIESSGNYEAIGDNGTSAGAFQWNNGPEKIAPGQVPKNFLAHAREAGVDVKDFSKASQNKVAYSIMKKWKDVDGLDPEEIAAKWNGAKRGADGKLTYVAPEYGEKFRAALFGGQIPSQAVPAGGTYAAPPEPKPFVASAPPVPEEDKGVGRKAAEFLFPILEDKERTGLQTAADLGLSALTLIPGLGAGGLAAKAAVSGGVKGVLKSLVPKIMSKSTVAKGTGVGYGYDVLSNVSEGDTGAEALTPGIGTITGAGAPLIARKFKGTKGVQKVLDDEAMKEASDLVSPTLTKKNVKEGLKKGLVGKSSGIKGEIGMDLDLRKQRAAESIKDLLKDGTIKSSDTVEKKVGVIRAEIADTAEELEQQLKDMDVVPIVQPDELQSLLKKTEDIFEESPALVGDAGLSAKRIYNKFVSFIPKGQDVTALDILRARKKLDQWVASEGRTGAFDPKLETAISKGLREIRQGANELLAQKAPNVQVQDMLRKQSSMYDALDGIIENEWKDVGTTSAGRYFKKHPYQKAALTGTLKTVGTGVVGGTVLGQYMGDKATN